MSTKTQVAALMARGQSPAEVSRELGITESYISQLRQDEEFLRILGDYQKQAAKVGSHSIHQKIDGHYDSLEYKTVSTLDANSDLILSQLIDKPTQLLAYLRTLNGAKRRSVGEAAPAKSAEQEYVAVVLPAFLTQAQNPAVIHNSQNEVISVDNRPLVSLSSAGLRNQLATHLAAKTPTAAAIARLELDAEVAAMAPTMPRALTPNTPTNSDEEQLDLFGELSAPIAPVAQTPKQVATVKSIPPNLSSFAPPQSRAMAPLDLSSL